MRVMKYADDAPTMASAANIAAFNLGNALGAYFCGLAITAGLGYAAPPWVGAIFTGAGLAVLIVATALARRSTSAPAPEREKTAVRVA